MSTTAAAECQGGGNVQRPLLRHPSHSRCLAGHPACSSPLLCTHLTGPCPANGLLLFALPPAARPGWLPSPGLPPQGCQAPRSHRWWRAKRRQRRRAQTRRASHHRRRGCRSCRCSPSSARPPLGAPAAGCCAAPGSVAGCPCREKASRCSRGSPCCAAAAWQARLRPTPLHGGQTAADCQAGRCCLRPRLL